MRVLTSLVVLGCSLLIAQTYRCDWNVVGIGGGDMAAGNYRCGATAGQTAAGQLTGTSYWAYIGFWQSFRDTVGVREEAHWPAEGQFVTRLYQPVPNPVRSRVTIRYSLSAQSNVSLTLHDLTGRVVRTLVNAGGGPGRYSVVWRGNDDRGRELAPGIYFCRFVAGDISSTEKLVLQR